MIKKNSVNTEILAQSIIEGIREKKGQETVMIDFSTIPNAAFRRFIICEGTSTTQNTAIADSVIDTVIRQCAEKPWHTEGKENAEWILLDYGDVVVHIFLSSTRNFYKLEQLWADAKIVPVSE